MVVRVPLVRDALLLRGWNAAVTFDCWALSLGRRCRCHAERGIVGNILSRFEPKGYKLAAMKTKQATKELLEAFAVGAVRAATATTLRVEHVAARRGGTRKVTDCQERRLFFVSPQLHTASGRRCGKATLHGRQDPSGGIGRRNDSFKNIIYSSSSCFLCKVLAAKL